MFKNINRFIVASLVILSLQSLHSMEIYCVKPGDYLFKIAKVYNVNEVDLRDFIDAIKGINRLEVPGIIDDKIQVDNKLIIPTNKNEINDGLILFKDFQENTLKILEDKLVLKSNDKKISFNYISNEIIDIGQTNIFQEDDSHDVMNYKNTLDNVDEIYKNNPITKKITITNLFNKFIKILFVIIIFVVLFVAIKKVYDKRNSKKAKEQEVLSKKKRDHLMSRISPVVSDTDFYKFTSKSSEESFDFFAKKNNENMNINYSNGSNSHYTNKKMNDQSNKNIVIKTERGIIVDTSCSTKFNSSNDEIDTESYEKHEIEYVEELVERYLESEKYVEASITIQDSLEEDSNNISLRYMLLEVYARASDEIAFEGEVHFIKSKNIVSMFDPLHQKIAKLRYKYFE